MLTTYSAIILTEIIYDLCFRRAQCSEIEVNYYTIPQ